MHEASRKFPKEWNSKFLIVSFYLFSPFIEDRGKNEAAKKNYSYRVVRETFHCVEEKRKKESTVGNLTKLCSKGMMKKKTGKHIRRKINFVRSLTRSGLRIFVFHFLFIFLSKQSMKMLQCLPWKCCVFLGPNIDRHENTSFASRRISTSFLINFSVIFRMSS